MFQVKEATEVVEVLVKESRKRKNLKKALAALRSGKYEQYFGADSSSGILKNGKEGTLYCALGVMAKVARFEWMEDEIFEKKFGIDQKMLDEIVRWNDRRKLSFDLIAEKIETEFLPKIP